jgi:putative acetyltransferase
MTDTEIIEAAHPDQLAQVSALLRDYLLWMRRRYLRQPSVIDTYFDAGEWQSELSNLSGHYGPPTGAIMLARVDGVAAGCALMRGIGEDACEMKRLFVRPAFQGCGIARPMVIRLAGLARDRGYRRMHLETGSQQPEAESLYRSMGFKPCLPYYACPQWAVENSRFYEVETSRVAEWSLPPELGRIAA